ncbi:MAG: gamma-glutamyltransferase [Bryobacteraceae bacterium]|nr:gamma-glutamyltransferase [Bryobacteraceae bacterium]
MRSRAGRIRIVLLLLCCTWAACAQQRRAFERPARYAARGTRGAVAGGSDLAVEAGMRIFHEGGNAVDAGCAIMFAAAIAEFSHFGFGGEAPILIRTKDGKAFSIAGIGTMPKLATADLFRKRELQPGEVQEIEPGGLKEFIPVAGLMPALVPGMVDATLLALREFGSLPLARVLLPAIELADGMPLDETRARSIAAARPFLQLWPTTVRAYLPNGRAPAPGEQFRQPDLARTMRALVAAEQEAHKAGKNRAEALDAVRDYFYRGPIARAIGEFSKVNGGLLRYEDLAAFRSRVEEPASTTYRGYTVYKSGFWSQGPVLLETLNILEGLPLARLGFNSSAYLHQVTEAMKLAYADRDAFYGDPEFADIPARELLSKEYAVRRRGMIGPRASTEFLPGDVGARPPLHPATAHTARVDIDEALVANDTTCVNAIDRDGVMFSSTPSGAWMPPVIAGDTGIPLTQRAQSFLLLKGHPNELAGGKRPRVTLSPTLVSKDGKAFAALSTPGGDVQDQALLQLLLNVIDFGMGAQRAVEAPRIQTKHLVSSFDNHGSEPGDLGVDERVPQEVRNELERLGHRVRTESRWSSGSAPVMIRALPNGVIEAAPDPYGYRVAQAW